MISYPQVDKIIRTVITVMSEKQKRQALRCLSFLAERTRFELVDRIAPIVGLANRWFQPLTHLSRDLSELALKGISNRNTSLLATAKLNQFYLLRKFFAEKFLLHHFYLKQPHYSKFLLTLGLELLGKAVQGHFQSKSVRK